MIQHQDIAAAIQESGLSNKGICIHASMSSFQDEIDGGVEMIANTFLSKGCTILVPTFSYPFETRPEPPYMPAQNGIEDYTNFLSNEDGAIDEIFSTGSKTLSVQEMGIFSKYILEREDSQRGNHPLNSFTAIGPQVRILVERQTPEHVYAPLQKLVEEDGLILLMGVHLDSATIIHYAEQLAGRNLFVRWAYDQNGNVKPVRTGGCSDGFRNFENILKGAETRTIVGGSIWRCYKAKNIVDICKRAITLDPKITHCDNDDCKRCNDAVLGGPIIDFR